MYGKLFPNIKRITRAFLASFVFITVSVLVLRLTAFSDMAVIPEQITSTPTEDGNAYQMYQQIYFPSQTSKADLFIANNSKDKLIKVNITLKATGDSILSTGFINPGAVKASDKLNPVGQQLADGAYECVAEVFAYSPDDVRTVIGTSRIDVIVYINEKPAK